MRCFFLLSALPILAHASGIDYAVRYEGVSDFGMVRAIKQMSQLTTLQDRPPASINALRYRAESDIPEILKVLHAQGYYEATATIQIEETHHELEVVVTIVPGVRYSIENYTLFLYSKSKDEPIECPKLTLEAIGISLGKSASARKVLDAELKTLQILADSGYPLAEIKKREIIADGQTKGLRIHLDIDTGPFSRFGEVAIEGTRKVQSRLIMRKVAWQQGEVYDSSLVENTQKTMMSTGLFSSVLITHDEGLDENGELPMRIDVTETKYRSVNIGASYQTFYGPGITFGWEHRNLGGMGRKISLQGDVTRRSHTGRATYHFPDFFRINQDYICEAIAMQESLTAYHQRSYSVTNRFERKIGKRIRVAGSAQVEQLLVTDSAENGKFMLLEGPLYFRWSTANSLLNPTRGMTFEYRFKPSLNIPDTKEFYLIQEATQLMYAPILKNEVIVFAQKVTLGSVWSNRESYIPIPKRFLGGSEDELRGYRYRTVSPLNPDGKPLGGRSAFYSSSELRFRAFKVIGLVPFIDVGQVEGTLLPPLIKKKWFKSTGLGLRYFSYVGPIRLDIAFPLDRRPGLDPFYKFLVSIGQAF
jgi:translocation and assembly module TamA